MAKFFINRPIVAMVISILMVIVGLVAMLGLPIAQFPNIADPQIQVNATYPGADAMTVEQSVATPIEQQMSGVDNMKYMYSLNANNGSMKLTVDFDVKTDPNTDQILAQMRQGQANSQLPGRRHQLGRHRPEVHLLAADHVRALFAEQHLRQHFPGELLLHQHQRPDDARAGHRQRLGFRRRPICHAPLGPTRPAGQAGHHRPRDHQRHPGAEHRQPRRQDWRRAGARRGRNSPTRCARRAACKPRRNSATSSSGPTPDGAIVRVKDVARIELGSQNYDMLARLNGKACALVALYQLPGSNALDAADGAKKLMAKLKQSFPPDLDYVVALDTTLAVTEGMKEIEHTLFEAHCCW